ncbi:hypothetical protein V6237_08020 [Pseudoalteromonas carrageenovora]|uniref:hypothetical protein n=1 Tax=Pseudoalteromonas carrageenovora TaxID=227 RepID=UPI00311D864C
MKLKYLSIPLLASVLTGCGTQDVVITKAISFEPSKFMRENAKTQPFLVVEIEGDGKTGTCKIDFPIGMLKSKRAIKGTGSELRMRCKYDDVKGYGTGYTHEYKHAELHHLGDNKATLSLIVVLYTRKEDLSIEVKTLKPLEFEYTL